MVFTSCSGVSFHLLFRYIFLFQIDNLSSFYLFFKKKSHKIMHYRNIPIINISSYYMDGYIQIMNERAYGRSLISA
ncbi:hypothetical protein METBIDRAFT_199467 [Metschnikowia bicuspidata var. bicuspidata NRRL YB-4993]|uniref:Uncharacterized protein n=1 Tax=Metschnikowia bicuspidata var. bicuspidata NRRL YB-4993 TaxID=869754 RepID=A0A1A0H9B6_9ASCO|nr:hypothetical protein METBIDRAFT_199467 [Metschnikowia bicuspidata var. bicuspidata NRRL YB-4993]OBA20468.1 hypothetical protein METBIDRAFT_199467 [Metschnikowia bicuspidata var. bicuspidata NRRL YB-4993]